mmetsp:Transcript_100060/g.288921  ORF Transcript_100060/g.288921 Transcript_100060/m.288921 type:complete len:169 (-) Transcript_100060:191-697(-)
MRASTMACLGLALLVAPAVSDEPPAALRGSAGEDDDKAASLRQAYAAAVDGLGEGESLIDCEGEAVCHGGWTQAHGVRTCHGAMCCAPNAMVLATGVGADAAEASEATEPEAEEMEKALGDSVDGEDLVMLNAFSSMWSCRGVRVCRGGWSWRGSVRVCRGGFYCRPY